MPGQDDRNMAVIAHASGIVTSFIGPLVILLVKREEGEYVVDQAREALNFQITLLIAYVAAFLLTFCVVGVFLIPLLMLAGLVLPVIAAVRSSEGQRYRYPATLRLIT